MSDTPKTDAMEQALYEGPRDGWNIEKTRLGLCRELERENARLKTELHDLLNNFDKRDAWEELRANVLLSDCDGVRPDAD